jgi:hypothetical protein
MTTYTLKFDTLNTAGGGGGVLVKAASDTPLRSVHHESCPVNCVQSVSLRGVLVHVVLNTRSIMILYLLNNFKD